MGSAIKWYILRAFRYETLITYLRALMDWYICCSTNVLSLWDKSQTQIQTGNFQIDERSHVTTPTDNWTLLGMNKYVMPREV